MSESQPETPSEEAAEFQPPTAESSDDDKVAYVLPILLELCPNPVDLVNLLVPISAAALEQVKAEPEHVTAYFFKVTQLMDKADAEKQPAAPAVTEEPGTGETQPS